MYLYFQFLRSLVFKQIQTSMQLLIIMILMVFSNLAISQLDSGVYIIQLSGTEYYLAESNNPRRSDQFALGLDTSYQYFNLSKNENGFYLIADDRDVSFLGCRSTSLARNPELIFSEKDHRLTQSNISNAYCNTWQLRKKSRSANGFELIPTCFKDYLLAASNESSEINSYTLILMKRNDKTGKKKNIWNFSKLSPASRKKKVKFTHGAQLPDVVPR